MTGGNAFEPSDIIIEVGDTIVWTTTGSLHTTTEGHPGDPKESWTWTSEFLSERQSFSRTFNELGEFPYFCRVHGSSMLGVVRVIEDLGEAGPPDPTPTRESSGGAASPGFDY